MARGLEYADAARQAAHDALDWRGMAAEVAAVEAAVRRLAPPQAFSHNDLLSGNILVSTLVRLCNDRRRSQRYNGARTARLGRRMKFTRRQARWWSSAVSHARVDTRGQSCTYTLDVYAVTSRIQPLQCTGCVPQHSQSRQGAWSRKRGACRALPAHVERAR